MQCAIRTKQRTTFFEIAVYTFTIHLGIFLALLSRFYPSCMVLFGTGVCHFENSEKRGPWGRGCGFPVCVV